MRCFNRFRHMFFKMGLWTAALVMMFAMAADTSVSAAPNWKEETPASAYIKARDWPEGPAIDAGGAVVMEADTGTVLYAKNPDTVYYPASITKIMTGLLTVENCDLSEDMVFTHEAASALPYNYVSIAAVEGEEMSVSQCLHAMLMYSANDAANGLACHIGGSIASFADMMNKRAEELGCKHTHFVNPSGVHDENHYTTPYDMCRIMRQCVKYSSFVNVSGKKSYTLKTNNKRKQEFTFYNRHSQLFPSNSHYYEYTICGKTGYTEEARNTLVTCAEKDGMRLICTVMYCNTGVTYNDTEKLFDWCFDNFRTVDAADSDNGQSFDNLGVFDSDILTDADVTISAAGSGTVVVPEGVSLKELDTRIKYYDQPEDGYFARLYYQYEGMNVGSIRLKAEGKQAEAGVTDQTASGESAAAGESTKAAEKDVFSRNINIDIRLILLLAAALIVLILLIRKITVRKKGIHFGKRHWWNRRR